MSQQETLEQSLVAFRHMIDALDILAPALPDPDGILADTLNQAKVFFLTERELAPEDRAHLFSPAPRLQLIAADGRSGLLLNDVLISEAMADDLDGLAMLQTTSKAIAEALDVECQYLDCRTTFELDLDAPPDLDIQHGQRISAGSNPAP